MIGQRERTIRVSLYGSGREHYHVILSKSRSVRRVLAVATFATYQEAGVRAVRVRDVYRAMGFTDRTYGAGTVLELSKDGETSSYLMTRRCTLRHQIDG